MSNETTDNFLDYIAAASCYPYTPTIGPAYGYRPSLGAAIFFVIAFTVLLAYHTFQSVRRRAAISILLALGALGIVPTRPNTDVHSPPIRRKKKTH